MELIYFKEEGEDSMLTLTFKKIALFLAADLDEKCENKSG